MKVSEEGKNVNLMLCKDEQIWEIDSSFRWHLQMKCEKTFDVYVNNKELFRTTFNQIEKFNAISNQWEAWFPIDTTNYSALTIYRDQFICTGSIRDNQQLAFSVDLHTKEKKLLPDLLFARASPKTQVFQDRLYVLGGMFGKTTTYGLVADVESYDGKEWQKHCSLPYPNFCFATAASATHLYMFGGMMGDSQGKNDHKTFQVFKYDPLIDKWQACAPMKNQHSHFKAHFWNNQILIYGTDFPCLNVHVPFVEWYDTVRDCWL